MKKLFSQRGHVLSGILYLVLVIFVAGVLFGFLRDEFFGSLEGAEKNMHEYVKKAGWKSTTWSCDVDVADDRIAVCNVRVSIKKDAPPIYKQLVCKTGGYFRSASSGCKEVAAAN